jgi:release factor glutamine methyltransferase
MPPAWTVRTLLTWMTQDFTALGLGTPRLDAELLLAHVLGCDRIRLYMDMDRPLSPTELAAARELVVRRRKREPVAYIRGEREFYRRAFEVTPAVLIPRPDTETLIERALALLPSDREARVLDLCTGSGAISVTLAAELPLATVLATDISEAALEVAARNAKRHAVNDRVQFHHGDLYAALPANERFDLIAANPPYISDAAYATLAQDITAHEPRLALTSGADGLDVLRRLCAETEAWLVPGGTLLFEIGHDQAEAVQALLAARTRL